ncbi:hypothetical protein TNCV_1233281 [Trichonephila clavipes]|nr:hypothetical protein TNCV_1233281 [Trichonephila clavipes]
MQKESPGYPFPPYETPHDGKPTLLVENNTSIKNRQHGVQQGGSVPVIWQNQARRLSGVHPEYSATASVRGSNGATASVCEDPTGKPATFYLQLSTLQSNVSPGTPKRGISSQLTGAGLTPATRLQRSVGQTECKRNPQDTLFLHTRRRTRQPTLLVENNTSIKNRQHGVQQGRQCAGHLAKARHGAYLEYTQNIVLQHQCEDPTGKPATFICSTNPSSNVSPGTPKRAYH